jgi:transcriptional regulator with XRE-family HTH domain
MLDARRAELKAFLRAMRARLSPEDAGLPGVSRRRRAPGLRIEEAASLADVSLTWYSALEGGKDIRVSDGLLEKVAGALRLEGAEREYLFDLASPRATTLADEDDELLQTIVDGFVGGPALVCDAFWTLRVYNQVADVVYGLSAARERNLLRRMFLDKSFMALHREWPRIAREMVQIAHLSYGRAPNHWYAKALVDDLTVASPEFRRWWSEQAVRRFETMTALLAHPDLGELKFVYASFAQTQVIRSGLPAFIVLQPAADEITKRNVRGLVEGRT